MYVHMYVQYSSSTHLHIIMQDIMKSLYGEYIRMYVAVKELLKICT